MFKLKKRRGYQFLKKLRGSASGEDKEKGRTFG